MSNFLETIPLIYILLDGALLTYLHCQNNRKISCCGLRNGTKSQIDSQSKLPTPRRENRKIRRAQQNLKRKQARCRKG
jgi:hypothetical protein